MSDIPCAYLWTYASDSVGVDEALARAGRKRTSPTGVLQKPEFSNNLKRLPEPPPHPKRGNVLRLCTVVAVTNICRKIKPKPP